MNVIQTQLMYISIIVLSTSLIWASEHFETRRLVISIKNRKYSVSCFRGICVGSAFLILIVPLVIRSCGRDTYVYYFDYTHDRIHEFDILFSYLLAFLHRFILDPKIGLGIISIITIGIPFFCILKVRKQLDVTLSFFAYVTCIYFYSYNYMRMLFAFAFVFVGYTLCLTEKKKLAFIPFIIAGFFHMSAFVVLIIHLTLMIFKRYRSFLVISEISGLLIFLTIPNYFLSLINVDRYSSQIQFASEYSIGVGTLLRALPILWIVIRYRNDYKKDDRYTWILVFTISNIVFSFLGYFVGVASRISNILLIFHLIFAVPLFIKEDEQLGRKQRVRWGFVIYCGIMYLLLTKNFKIMEIVPYY